MKGFKNQPVENGNIDAAKGTNPNIRLFTVKRNAKISEVEDVVGKWEEAKPLSIRDFSATAYYFGRMLEEELQVPVGLICVAWGGSACEAWMTPEMLERLLPFMDYESRCNILDKILAGEADRHLIKPLRVDRSLVEAAVIEGVLPWETLWE